MSASLDLSLHPKQGTALQTHANEVLYGGAAGGGKSHLMRCASVIWCAAIPGLQVYLFRRIREDLVKNHMEGPKGFRAMLAGWVNAKFCIIVEDEIRFWNGSKIYLCHCKDEKDIYKYQGAEIHVLLMDELTHFTESMYRFLRNRVRMVGVAVSEAFAGMFPRILCGANPGNIGHLWVKRTFVDGIQDGQIRLMDKTEGGMRRQFIRAQLEDNPSMTTDDPGYESRLEGLGSKALVQAMRHGDWDVIEGAFFDEWEASRHVVRPFAVPKAWKRFRSMDWGSASPFSVGWWAIVPDEVEADNMYGQPVVLPRGAIVRYREWYGAKGPNDGLKMDAESVGRGIAERSGTEEYAHSVLDPAAFAQHGGPSIAEMLIKGGASFGRADNTRVPQRGAMSGWDQVRRRLKGDAEGHAMMFVFSTCVDTIRTLPALQHDKDRPEDLNTDMEDHAADDVRYACNSRPWLPVKPPEKPKNYTYVADTETGLIKSSISFAEIMKRQERAAKRR